MCENITHVAIGEDSLRLASLSPDICQAFKDVIAKYLDLGRMGTINRNILAIRLLQRLRDDWETRRPEDNLEKKLVYWLGSMLHQCGDKTMWPIYLATLNLEDPNPQSECRAYHDVYLFKEIYGSGKERPYSPGLLDVRSLLGSKAFSKDVEGFFQVLMRRALLSVHTVIPAQDTNDWLDRLFLCREKNIVSLSHYAEAFTNPDPVKLWRYLTGPNFYDPEDNIIKIARRLQRGEAVEWLDIEKALKSAEEQSYYAKALARGYKYIKAASLFFLRKITAKDLMDALEWDAETQARPFYSRWVEYFVVGKQDEVRYQII